MLLITMLLLVSLAKAQHIELSYPSTPPSNYCTTPTVWLDGDSIRFSMNVIFPPIDVILDDNVGVWLGCGGSGHTYAHDLYWTNANRPTGIEIVYSGAISVDNLYDGEGIDVNYGVQFENSTQVLGINSMVMVTYYFH